jgi:hypothetical protein
MEEQTAFLKDISEGFKAVRIVGRFLIIIGTAITSGFGLWNVFKALKGQ